LLTERNPKAIPSRPCSRNMASTPLQTGTTSTSFIESYQSVTTRLSHPLRPTQPACPVRR
jgi:hypothetical protein